MPPKKRPAGEDLAGRSEPVKRKTATPGTTATASGASRPSATSAPRPAGSGSSNTVSRPGGTPARPTATGSVAPKLGVARQAGPKGVRKVHSSMAGSAASAAGIGGPLGARPKNSLSKHHHHHTEVIPPVVTRNTLMWFRTDLRLQDNRGLYEAWKKSKSANTNLICIYIQNEKEWARHDEASVKIDFWLRNLQVMKQQLDKLAIPLVIRHVGSKSGKEEVVKVMEGLVKELDVSHVYWNIEYMVDELARDSKVKMALKQMPGVVVEEVEDQCVVPPKMMIAKTGLPYTSFKSFHFDWRFVAETNKKYLEIVPGPEANPTEAKTTFGEYLRTKISLLPSTSSFSIQKSCPHMDEHRIRERFPAGETVAQKRLSEFMEHKVFKYHLEKDSLEFGVDEFSTLGPYLTSGILSTRQCIVAAKNANQKSQNKITVGDEGILAWVKELCWREYYTQIVVAFPKVCKRQAFLEGVVDGFRWSSLERTFLMWCQGKTGYPIIDAAMRQLNATGWIHNRLRILTATFLVKDLMHDWQKGEKYFMQNLIDGEFSSNNGAWQWCASTGVDAQPYFKMVHPSTLSAEIDPSGDYIRQWVPELSRISSEKDIHDPYSCLTPKEFAALGYQKPIVDHVEMKKKCVEEFRRVLELQGEVDCASASLNKVTGEKKMLGRT